MSARAKILAILFIATAVVIFMVARKATRHVPPPVPLKPVRIIPPQPMPQIPIKGRIAIIIDDWGYHLNTMDQLKQIKSPLTLAVLPNLDYSTQVAKQAHNMGFEIMLHLPMQPLNRTNLEENTITTSMNSAKIQKIINTDLADIPYIKGINNHMGSKITEDPQALQKIFTHLKKRNLYFIDSYVTSKSAAQRIARDNGIRFGKRDIFLDNQNNPAYIIQQLNKLKARARLNGFAIGIGHDRVKTLDTLIKAIPELEKEGYQFVYASELVK